MSCHFNIWFLNVGWSKRELRFFCNQKFTWKISFWTELRWSWSCNYSMIMTKVIRLTCGLTVKERNSNQNLFSFSTKKKKKVNVVTYTSIIISEQDAKNPIRKTKIHGAIFILSQSWPINIFFTSHQTANKHT